MLASRERAIRERLEAVTPGEWSCMSEQVSSWRSGIVWMIYRETWDAIQNVRIASMANHNDALFFLWAVQDMRELLDYVGFLRGLIHDLREESSAYQMGLRDGRQSTGSPMPTHRDGCVDTPSSPEV